MASALKWIISLTIIVAFIFLIAFIGLNVAAIYEIDPEHKRALQQLIPQIGILGVGAWEFIRPFLQLIIVIVIILWLLEKLGVSLTSRETRFEWNVQVIIALIIVSAFAIAALAGISDSIGALKDLALVVVGFYFGTQKKSLELQTDKGILKILEEHINAIKAQQKPEPRSEPQTEEGDPKDGA
jgi:hypothetical protein